MTDSTNNSISIHDSVVRELKQDFSSHVNVENKHFTVVQSVEENPEDRTAQLLVQARSALIAGHALVAAKTARQALSLAPASSEAALLLALACLSRGPIKRLVREEAREIVTLLRGCMNTPATAQCAWYALGSLCYCFYAKNGYSEPEPGYDGVKKLFYAKWAFLSEDSEELVRSLGVEDDFDVMWCG